MLALAVMAEIPLVVVDVQRGGPSTGLPTKVEQGDLLSSIFGMPGDSPKVVMAASSIDECFHFVITARKLAEAFYTPVIVLTDANLATGQTSFPCPEPNEDWLSPPLLSYKNGDSYGAGPVWWGPDYLHAFPAYFSSGDDWVAPPLLSWSVGDSHGAGPVWWGPDYR